MKYKLIYCCSLLFCLNAQTQTVFFKSDQSIDKGALQDFYASLAMQDGVLLFNAPDYKLYAYDTRTALLKWSYHLGRRSDVPPHFVQQVIWANGNKNVVELDAASGAPVKTLSLQSVLTAPLIKGNILYTTGINDGGKLIAYDRQADTIVWQRFLAHGCSVKPYYQAQKIVANAEASNWMELDYNGRFANSACSTSEESLPAESNCVSSFTALTHDGKAIKGKLAEKIAGENNEPEIFHTSGRTWVLQDGVLSAIANKLKLVAKVNLYALDDTLAFNHSRPAKILRATDNNVWVLHGDYLLHYDLEKKKLAKALDLRKYDVHQAVLDEHRLWLISRNDGLLYGLHIE